MKIMKLEKNVITICDEYNGISIGKSDTGTIYISIKDVYKYLIINKTAITDTEKEIYSLLLKLTKNLVGECFINEEKGKEEYLKVSLNKKTITYHKNHIKNQKIKLIRKKETLYMSMMSLYFPISINSYDKYYPSFLELYNDLDQLTMKIHHREFERNKVLNIEDAILDHTSDHIDIDEPKGKVVKFSSRRKKY